MAIVLTGRLVCANDAEADTVRRELPRHIALTRAEPGCETFDVAPAPDDPWIFLVAERFSDRAAFEAHQTRARLSDWGVATVAIVRDFEIAETE